MQGLTHLFTRRWQRWLAVAWLATGPVLAHEPVFSHMTLNGITTVGLSVEDIDRDLLPWGLSPARLEGLARERLSAAGFGVLDRAAAVADPNAALLRIRIITNRDAQGFYHLSVKLELRKKIPLGNPAGGFVSEAVWTAAENGVMLASEVEKIEALLDPLLAGFVTALKAQNAGR